MARASAYYFGLQFREDKMEIRNQVVSDGYVISYQVESGSICQIRKGQNILWKLDHSYPLSPLIQALFDSYMREFEPHVILSEVKEKRLNFVQNYEPEDLIDIVNGRLIPAGVELLGSPQVHVENGRTRYTQFYMETVK